MNRQSISGRLVTLILMFLGWAVQTRADVNRWTTRGPEGGNIALMALDAVNPDLLYASLRDGRVFRSIDGGGNWSVTNDPTPEQVFLGYTVLAADPVEGNKVYAGGAGLFKSTDGAVTWQPTALRTLVQAMAVDPADHRRLYAANSSSIYRSTDAGTSWQQVYSVYLGDVVQFIISANASAYVVTQYSHVLRSNDLGMTWQATSLPAGATRLTINPKAPATQYAYGQDVVYKSTDEGQTWTQMNPSVGPGSLFVTPQGDTLYLANPSGFYRSIDQGATWLLVNQTVRPFVLLFDPQRPARFYAWGSRILVTTNGGADWSDATHGIINWNVSAVAVDPVSSMTIYAGLGGLKSTDAGATWNATTVPYEVVAIDPSNPGTVYAGATGVFKSADGGVTWSASNGGPSHGVSSLAIDPVTSSRLYAAGYADRLYKSTDSGTSWAPLALDPYIAGPIQSVVVAPSRPETVYAAGAYATYRSDDGGISWVVIGGGAYRLAVDPVNAELVYLITSSLRQLLKTPNGGRTWASFGPPRYYGAITTDPNKPNVVYFGTGTPGVVLSSGSAVATAENNPGETVYRSKDAGTTWIAIANTLANAGEVRSLAVAPSDSSIVYAGTQSSGLYSIKLVPLAGDANEDFTLGVADVFYLIHYLFAAGPAPSATADANGDGAVNASDIFYLINYLFADGPSPR